jgi:Ca2+-binding RTX toxin-like protein
MTTSLLATQGDDTIAGTAVDDYFDGLAGDDIIFGGIGADQLEGNDGNDTIYADTYANLATETTGDVEFTWNKLAGNAGEDTLISNAGGDDLWGGIGNDTMFGGAGEDWFVFEPGSGIDYIIDFTAGEDIIVVMENMNGTGDPTLSQNQDGTVVDFGNGNAAVLLGVSLDTLPADAVQTAPYFDYDSFYSTGAASLLS